MDNTIDTRFSCCSTDSVIRLEDVYLEPVETVPPHLTHVLSEKSNLRVSQRQRTSLYHRYKPNGVFFKVQDGEME